MCLRVTGSRSSWSTPSPPAFTVEFHITRITLLQASRAFPHLTNRHECLEESPPYASEPSWGLADKPTQSRTGGSGNTMGPEGQGVESSVPVPADPAPSLGLQVTFGDPAHSQKPQAHTGTHNQTPFRAVGKTAVAAEPRTAGGPELRWRLGSAFSPGHCLPVRCHTAPSLRTGCCSLCPAPCQRSPHSFFTRIQRKVWYHPL